MSLRYRLLGPLTVESAANPIALGSPRQRSVLAVLLVNANRPLSSDQLIEAVWGNHPPRSAQATLQAYISNLRRALEPDRPPRGPAAVLQSNGGGYQLTVEPEAVDALHFEELLDRATGLVGPAPARARVLLTEALGLWRGPALADFRYDDFAQPEIARLEDLRITAVEQRIAADLATGRSDGLIAELEALVAAHPLRERLWGHLMLALYRAGRQAESLRAYRRCEARLAEELGISPGESLRALELSVLSQDPALTPSAPPAADEPPGPRGLVGRVAERQALGDALARARSSRGTVVVVDGEPGIGKTRLMEAFARDAVAAGFTTAFARCVEVGGAPPFWPWMQLCRQLGGDAVTAAAGDYARNLGPLLPAGAGQPLPGRPLFYVAEALTEAFQTLAAQRPLLLVIDDVYSADPDSLSLLALIAAGIGDAPVAIAATHRGHDLGTGHPLSATLAELARLDWVVRLPLRRLELAEVGELVRGMAGASVDDGTIRTIHERSEGNAFFAIELTRLLQSEHGLSPERAASTVPATVLEVMGRRLGGLSDDAQRVVRTGAVYGRVFDLAVVADALGLEFADAAAAADDGLRSGLLLETGDAATFRFSHVIVVDTVTGSLGALRRATTHQRIADVLERRYGGDPSRWVEIAHHRVQALTAGGAGPAIAALGRAGDHAMQSTALELAEELFDRRHSLVLAEPLSAERDRLEMASLFDLARLWTWREGYHSPRLGVAARRLWDLVGMTAGEPDFPPGVPITSADPVLSALQARFSYEIVAGNGPAAAEVTARLANLAARVPDPMVTLAASVATCVFGVHAPRVGDAVAAVAEGRAALEVLDPARSGAVMLPLGQQSGWVTHHAFAGWAHWLAGDRAEARGQLAAARDLCDRWGHPFTRIFNVTVECIVAAMDRSPEWAAEAIAWGEQVDDAGVFGLMKAWRSMAAAWSAGMLDGDPEAAAAQIRATLGRLHAEGALVVQTLYWAMVAELELRADRPRPALQAARTGFARAAATGERFWLAELERLAAEALRALGRPGRAQEALRRATEVAREHGIPLLEARLAPVVAT